MNTFRFNQRKGYLNRETNDKSSLNIVNLDKLRKKYFV